MIRTLEHNQPLVWKFVEVASVSRIKIYQTWWLEGRLPDLPLSGVIWHRLVSCLKLGLGWSQDFASHLSIYRIKSLIGVTWYSDQLHFQLNRTTLSQNHQITRFVLEQQLKLSIISNYLFENLTGSRGNLRRVTLGSGNCLKLPRGIQFFSFLVLQTAGKTILPNLLRYK